MNLQSHTQYLPVILIAFLELIIILFVIFNGLIKSYFSTLYWLSLATIFTIPLCFDLLFGLPEQAFIGRVRYLAPYAQYGIVSATYFSFGHIIVTCITYYVCIKILLHKESKQSNSHLSWIIYSNSAWKIFFIVFILSSLFSIYKRIDLSRPFNEFLDPSSKPSYEAYFYFASSPIISILLYRRGGKKFTSIVIILSTIVAYYFGVRYYMFPFIGYYVWVDILSEHKTLMQKVRKLILFGIFAWIALTMWGIIRGLNIRNNPTAIIEDPLLVEYSYGSTLKEQLLLGNEFPTRMACYDIISRLNYLQQYRGIDSVISTFISFLYPSILRLLNIEFPVSNAKLIYQIQTGITGSGVSTATTIFGNDWFTWGWLGILIGGVYIGLILALGDFVYNKRNTLWIIIGPMWTFQLIFFVRGGTDFWLWIWGRYLPITIVLLILIRLLDNKSNYKFITGG